MIFLPSTPGTLIERIAILSTYDPANTQFTILLEREHELYMPSKHGDVRLFTDAMADLKARMIKAQSDMRQAKHDLFAAAMAPNTQSSEYQALIKDFKVADQAIIEIKADVDRLVSGIDLHPTIQV